MPYYGDRRIDAHLLRELSESGPKALSDMLGVSHAVRRHVGDASFAADRVLEGRLGVPDEGSGTDTCGVFESESDLVESLADAVYANAADISGWLCAGSRPRCCVTTLPGLLRPGSDAPTTFRSVGIDRATNRLSLSEVHGVRVVLTRSPERPLQVAAMTCYPCAVADVDDPVAVYSPDLRDVVTRTRAYADARSDSQRLALLAACVQDAGCSVDYDARRDRAIVRSHGSDATYSFDATRRGLRMTMSDADGARRVWDVADRALLDDDDMTVADVCATDRNAARTVGTIVDDAYAMGMPISPHPARHRELADVEDGVGRDGEGLQVG